MKHALVLVCAIGLLWVIPRATAGNGGDGDEEFTDEFRLEDCRFSDRGRNAFFSIEPGDKLILEGEEEGEELRIKITVLNTRKTITFRTPDGERLRVRTRVVEERESVDGELVEISRNFFARCTQTDDIFYFGEEVDDYEDGVLVGHGGEWRAGVAGALPGLIMPGTYLLGSRYFQEIAPGVALDRAEHTAMGLTVKVPAGTFEDCVEVEDSSALNPGAEGDTKIYCPGIGLVIDEDAELVDYDVDEDDDSRDD